VIRFQPWKGDWQSLVMILINLSAKRVGILIKIGEFSVFGIFWLFVAGGQRAILLIVF